ncbi:MAG: hypothetical protein N2Z62_12860 [Rhodobacteraceae bacterium]|nr:hypothetical protein [Paracoccaceae bacterium]
MPRWTLSCILGEAPGLAVVALAAAAAGRGLGPAEPTALAAAALAGLAIGAAQAPTMVRLGRCGGCWILASLLAALPGFGLLASVGAAGSALPAGPLAAAAAGALAGALLGAVQAIAGRGAVHPRRWILGSALARAAGAAGLWTACTGLAASLPPAGVALAGAAAGGAAGLLLGLVTAPALPGGRPGLSRAG